MARKNYVSVWGWILCALVTLDAIAIALSSIAYLVFNWMQPVPHSPSSYFYTSLVIFVALCLLYFAVDAVVQENIFQLIAFLVVSVLLTVAVIGNFATKFNSEGKSIGEWIPLISLTVIEIIFQVLFFLLAIPVSRAFGWKVFKIVGTNKKLVGLYHVYEIWCSVLKIDMLLTLSIGLMGGFFIIFKTITLVFFTVCLTGNLILSFVSIWASRREIRPLLIVFILWTIALPGYLFYKLVMVWVFFPEDVRDFSDQGGQSRQTVRWVLSAMSIVAIAWRVLLFVMSIWVTINFGKGLDKAFSKEFGISPKQPKSNEAKKPLLNNNQGHSNDPSTTAETESV